MDFLSLMSNSCLWIVARGPKGAGTHPGQGTHTHQASQIHLTCMSLDQRCQTTHDPPGLEFHRLAFDYERNPLYYEKNVQNSTLETWCNSAPHWATVGCTPIAYISSQLVVYEFDQQREVWYWRKKQTKARMETIWDAALPECRKLNHDSASVFTQYEWCNYRWVILQKGEELHGDLTFNALMERMKPSHCACERMCLLGRCASRLNGIAQAHTHSHTFGFTIYVACLLLWVAGSRRMSQMLVEGWVGSQ